MQKSLLSSLSFSRVFFLLFAVSATLIYAGKIPETLFKVPEKRSMNQKDIDAAQPFLKLSPQKYFELVPKESPAPVLTETSSFNSSYNNKYCPFCGKASQWFKYDLVNDPDHIYCAQTGRDLMTFPLTGKMEFTDYSGRKYERGYFISPYIKPFDNGVKEVKVFPENYFAKERITALVGTYKGGALMPLARAYYATGDEKYAERAIAILDGFAHVMKDFPWTAHSRLEPLTRQELLEKAKLHESGYHGWLGPARLGAAMNNFRNPEEAMYFTNFCDAFMMLAPSKSWRGRREFILENLLQEGSLHFRAYGAKQCVGNGIGMYAPALLSLGVVLKDEYLYDGFIRIMEDFLYNENFHDGISTEGSAGYSAMVGGMWNLFRKAGLYDDPEFMRTHPTLKVAGHTISRAAALRGGTFNYGDSHAEQYVISRPTPDDLVSGDEFCGFGVSIIRAGSADKRMELTFQHDRVTGHAHDDMLGIQLYYRGIPMLEHYGDTRDTLDLTPKVPDYEKFEALKYPAPIVKEDKRPRGFCVQDMNTPLTKNRVIVDNYWGENGWYTAYRGGSGEDARCAYGNLSGRTGMAPEQPFQFVEAEGSDVNSKHTQGMRMYKRALAVVTRQDGSPYVVDFFMVAGGHRHLMLFNSRGTEIESTLGKGKTYQHLENLPGIDDGTAGDTVANFTQKASSVFFPGNVFNNVNYGARVNGSWHHAWLFDYAAWAPKTKPLAKSLTVPPHVLSIYGFLYNTDAKAVRAEGHYPVTIAETFDGRRRQQRFQFANAIHYAGIMAQCKEGIEECYVHCMECHSKDEPAQFKIVKKLECDARGFCRAVEITFNDGSRDIVFWQPTQKTTSWGGEMLCTDARSGLVRIAPSGKVSYAVMTGGHFLKWRKKTLLENGHGVLTGRLADIEGDITGKPESAVLVVKEAEKWPEGDALKGNFIVATYDNGARREPYIIERTERKGTLLRVYLDRAPFFIDHRGKVTKMQSPDLLGDNQFWGTETAKGSSVTRYLSGSKMVFPDIKKEYTVMLHAGRNDYCQRWTTVEKVNLAADGVKVGMDFLIMPNWENCSVEVMSNECIDLAPAIAAETGEQVLGANAKVYPGFIETPDDNTLWRATGKDIAVAAKDGKYLWGTEKLSIRGDEKNNIVMEGSGSCGINVPMYAQYPWTCFDVGSAMQTVQGYYALSINLTYAKLPCFGVVNDVPAGMYIVQMKPENLPQDKATSRYMRLDIYSGSVKFNKIEMVKEPPCRLDFGGKDIAIGKEVALHLHTRKPSQSAEIKFYLTYGMHLLEVTADKKSLQMTSVDGSNGQDWICKFQYSGLKGLGVKAGQGVKPYGILAVVTVEDEQKIGTYNFFNDVTFEN